MKTKFKIKYRGIDGNSTESFSTLAAAGKYLAERYQGAEYLRGLHTMGTDYAQYELIGFSLNEVGQFDFSEGFKDFQFYDWAGGKLVQIRRFTVVSRGDCVGDGQAVVARFDGEGDAISAAVNLCGSSQTLYVLDGDQELGYASKSQWHKNVPFEYVAVAESEPAPF